jgi:hypothetical protein
VNLGGRSGVLLLALAGCGRGAAPAEPRAGCGAADRVLIADEADLAAVAGCASLPTLTVRTAAAVDLARLTRLVAIEGDLAIGPTLGITSISLPALERVGGGVRIAGNGDLQTLLLPALRTATDVEIVGNPSLTSISAPALGQVHGLLLEQLPALEVLDTASLAVVGDGPRVRGVPALTTWIGPPGQARGVEIDAPRLDAETRAAIGRESAAPQ